LEPKTKELIAQYPELSVEEAKLIFIRQSAQEAYINNQIETATKDILKEIIEIATVASMSKEEIGQHIGNLEKVRGYLAAFTQGLMRAHCDEEEPKIRAKRAKEEKEKKAAKSNDLQSKLAGLGISMDSLMAGKKVENSTQPETQKTINKVKCEHCGSEVYSLKFHKCPAYGKETK